MSVVWRFAEVLDRLLEEVYEQLNERLAHFEASKFQGLILRVSCGFSGSEINHYLQARLATVLL
jgi:hypothetical protein